MEVRHGRYSASGRFRRPRATSFFAKKTKDAAQARRLLARAAIYGGAMRSEAAKIGDVTLQIVRDWVTLLSG
jgi:hypothetical protein